MKQELNKEQVKKDLVFLALKIMKASNELQEAYLRINEIYKEID